MIDDFDDDEFDSRLLTALEEQELLYLTQTNHGSHSHQQVNQQAAQNYPRNAVKPNINNNYNNSTTTIPLQQQHQHHYHHHHQQQQQHQHQQQHQQFQNQQHHQKRHFQQQQLQLHHNLHSNVPNVTTRNTNTSAYNNHNKYHNDNNLIVHKNNLVNSQINANSYNNQNQERVTYAGSDAYPETSYGTHPRPKNTLSSNNIDKEQNHFARQKSESGKGLHIVKIDELVAKGVNLSKPTPMKYNRNINNNPQNSTKISDSTKLPESSVFDPPFESTMAFTNVDSVDGNAIAHESDYSLATFEPPNYNNTNDVKNNHFPSNSVEGFIIIIIIICFRFDSNNKFDRPREN